MPATARSIAVCLVIVLVCTTSANAADWEALVETTGRVQITHKGKLVATVSPGGFAASSFTAARLALPRVGASFTAVMSIVTLCVPCSEIPSPLAPGSIPTFPRSLTVTVMVVLALGASLLFR